MDILAEIAENRIREAMERGEFENLPGKGRPLPPEDLSLVPGELRMSYRVLKNAGLLPPEIELHKEITSLRQLMACCLEEGERQILQRTLNEKLLRFNLLIQSYSRRVPERYRHKIYRRLARK